MPAGPVEQRHAQILFQGLNLPADRALGHMQFLAGNWIKYGVDATGDGRADPYNAVDALASAANMLKKNGWKAGKPFGQGTANFKVLSVWNDSGNYQRAIAYAAGLVDAGG